MKIGAKHNAALHEALVASQELVAGPIPVSEERVMRAREVLAAAFAKLPHGRARAESFRVPAYTTDDDRVILSAMLTFAAEASGIGVLLSAIDAWMADPSPETEQGIMDARDTLAPSWTPA